MAWRGEGVTIPCLHLEIEKLEQMDLITTRQEHSNKPERGRRAELMVKMSERGQKVGYEMEVRQGNTDFGDLQTDGANRFQSSIISNRSSLRQR
ncbi:MAG: hypothetical protein R3D71_01720 [Rickettsiales bacterium]